MPAPSHQITKNKALVEFIQATGERCAVFHSPRDNVYRMYDKPGKPVMATKCRAEVLAAFDMLVAERLAKLKAEEV